VSSSLGLHAPATLTVFAGSGALSSLGASQGIGVSADAGPVSVTLTAQNAAAALAAGVSGGAAVAGTGNSLTISGTALEVNTALAALQVSEPLSATGDVLSLAVSGTLASATTDIAVQIAPAIGPAFVAPAKIVTLAAGTLEALPYLTLSDPIASGLAAMGLGAQETLVLTLAVPTGALLLPGFADAGGIAATGLGTGTIELSLTANELGALNTLLAGLEFAGPAVTEEFSYAVRNAGGVLPAALSFGNIFLRVVGSAATAGTVSAGAQSVALGNVSLAAGLALGTTFGVLGNVSAAAGVTITPAGDLAVPAGTLSLGGSSLDLGTLTAGGLGLGGMLLAANAAALSGEVQVFAGGVLDFNTSLAVDAFAAAPDAIALSLAAGAIVTGDGTLQAGNFSDAGQFTGPGTIMALSGTTLSLLGQAVGGGTELAVAAGAVMVLGPVQPLFGIFDATPLTIDSTVTLAFLGNLAAGPVTGGDAGTLGGAGGAFVINGPEVFAGTIVNFGPGDELIFPGLTALSIFNAGPGSFSVGGLDGTGATVDYTLHAVFAGSLVPYAGFDVQGDAIIGVRPTAASIGQIGPYQASAGIAQPLQGIALQLIDATTQSLQLTLQVGHGTLGDGTLGGATLTLAAAGLAAMNTELAGLSYTGTGVADVLTVSSGTGVLAGLQDVAFIEPAGTGVVSGFAAAAFSEGQIVQFSGNGGINQVSMPLAAGELWVQGGAAFENAVQVNGISGTALAVDGGGQAIFDAPSAVKLAGDVTIGDAAGPGLLAVLTESFSTAGNLTLAAAAAGAGSLADILGSVSLAGTIALGPGGTGELDLAGSLAAAGLVIDASGSFVASGSAAGALGSITQYGAMLLENQAGLTAATMQASGALTLGAGTTLALTGGFTESGAATLQVGQGALLTAGTVDLATGGTLTVAGTVAGSALLGDVPIALAGGTLSAASLTLGSGGTLMGNGSVNAGTLTNDGTILVQGGRLLLQGNVANTGTVALGTLSALELGGGFTGAPISFTAGGGLLTIDDVANFSGSVQGMVGSDVIDLVGIAATQISVGFTQTSGTITARDLAGGTLAVFGMQIDGVQPGFSIVSDGAGGSLLTLGGELPCFAAGTRLLTPQGYVAVETLKPGDPVITAAGAKRPLRWIGRRTLDLGPLPAQAALPVRIAAGAFAPGIPARPLLLSPLHCVFAEARLVPATHLVNGATITRDRSAMALTYYHLELDRHDILLAEALPCESYFDNGNRGALYQESGRRSPATRPFAPMLTGGQHLAIVRRRLHARALALGFSLTYWPRLRAVVGGQGAVPQIVRRGGWRIARFTLEQAVRDIVLISDVAAPADTDPDSEDRRELGICVPVAGGMEFGAGWLGRAAGDAGLWMGRSASLHLAEAQDRFELPIAAIPQSWVPPVDGAVLRG
jgi:hypothetical protein